MNEGTNLESHSSKRERERERQVIEMELHSMRRRMNGGLCGALMRGATKNSRSSRIGGAELELESEFAICARFVFLSLWL